MYQWNTIYTYDLKHLADCCKEEWILTKSTGFIKATICRILCRFAEALNKLFWSFETDVKWPENSKATVQVDLLHSLKEQSRKILLPSAGATWSRPAANTSVHDLTQCHIKTKAAHTEGPQSLNNYCTCTLSVFCLLWSATAHYGTVRSWKHSVTPARVCVWVWVCALRIDFIHVTYVFLEHISDSVRPEEKQTAPTQPRVKRSICGRDTLIYSAALTNPICASAVRAL